MKKQYEYDRKGIFVNFNNDIDPAFLAALGAYVEENGLRFSTALKNLARKQLIAEGKLKLSKARN